VTEGRHVPAIMGIVNVTPDSFSDGGLHDGAEAAVRHGLRLLDEGADLLDIGGESTRPGSAPVDARTECARVLPVLQGLKRARPDALLSIDTSKPEVARAAIDAGATWVNDVTGGTDPDMLPLCAEADVFVILMHMRGTPATMQHDTRYDRLLDEVGSWLDGQVSAAVAAGVARHRIWVDPGIGFGKALADNPRLVASVCRLRARTGCPVLIGASRKRFIGALTGVDDPSQRVHGSVGVALAAAMAGAGMLRVHDVAATRHPLTTFVACGGLG